MIRSKELAMEWVFEEEWKWRYVMGRERGGIVYLKKPKYVLALRQSNSVLIISRFSVFWSWKIKVKSFKYCVLNCCCLSVVKLCPTLFDPMDCSRPGFPVLHHLPEFAQTHVYWVSDAIQPFHLLSPPSSPALSLSQHQGLSQWVDSLHQVAKVLELSASSSVLPMNIQGWFL